MKKFLVITAVATGFLSLGLISQGFSHNELSYDGHCHGNHCLEIRPSTNRLFAYNQYNRARQISRLERLQRNQVDQFGFWRNYQRQITQTFDRDAYDVYKNSRSNFFPRRNNTLPQPHKLAVRETAYQQNYNWDSLRRMNFRNNQDNFFVAATNTYRANIPKSFTQTDDNNYYDADRDLTVNIERGIHNCNRLSFQLCASQKGTDQRTQFEEVKNVLQQFSLRQVQINGSTALFPAYKETFIARENGIEYVYFYYSTMNPATQNIVNVSAVAPAANQFAATNIINELFRTIQL